MKAKDKHRINILKYLSNTSNNWPSRTKFGMIILGITEATVRNHFTGLELDDIEAEGLILRRKRCVSSSAKVDKGLMERAETGDPAACKLYYQRIEGWTEKSIKELTGKDGGPIKTETELSPESQKLLQEITKNASTCCT